MTVGTDGNDTLTGTAGNDHLEGLAGDDRLIGAGGTDQTLGGAGNDTHYVDRTADLAIEAEGEGYDTVQSSATYTLGAHIERLVLGGTAAIYGTGNDLANVIVGNSAANLLNGGAGADQMRGGGGDDTYYVDHTGDRIFEISPADGFDQVRSSVSFSLGSYLEKLILTGAAAINGNGNILANVLIGNSAANGLNGGQGADQMRGGGGDDIYVVDNAGDQVFEISAADGYDQVRSSVSFSLGSFVEKLTLTGTAAIDGNGNALANILLGNSADNVLNGGGDADQMRGGGGNDTYIVDNAGDQIFEIDPAHGIDLVRSSVSFTLGSYLENLTLTGVGAIDGNGNPLANVITGNGAANVLNGGGGADTMTGGGGNDTYVVDTAGDQVIETSAAGGIDLVRSSVTLTLVANLENLTLIGAGAIDGTGNALANIITGNAAANVLNGDGGDDTMTGGGGNDTYFVDTAGDQVIESSAAGGIDLVRSAIAYTLGTDVENLILTGTGGLAGTGNDLANDIVGNSGANLLDGRGGADRMEGDGGDDTYTVDDTGDQVVEASATGGVDQVNSSASFTLGTNVENLALTGTGAIDGIGNTLANIITGNAAANVLNGDGGDDTMTGGGGNDTYFVDTAGDQVVETSAAGGIDLVRSAIAYTLGAQVENLVLTGTGGLAGTGNGLANDIVGNSGANLLDGRGGADRLEGGDGNDTYTVDHAGDQVVETSAAGGVDRVNSSASFTLGSNVENLTLTGAGAINGTGNGLANIITGNGAANVLNGDGGDDTMTGGGGNDVLGGGAGMDQLTGNAGADTFAFSTALNAANIDQIVDFNPNVDIIQLAGAPGEPFAVLASGALWLGAFTIGSAAAAQSHRIIYNNVTGALLFDADGFGGAAAVQFATLSPGLSLTAWDFVVSGPPNTPTEIVSGSTAQVEENIPTSTIVYQTEIVDPDGDTIEYRLDGPDWARFTMDENGAVRFISPPNFEVQNSFSIRVLTWDSAGMDAEQLVTITVTDISETADPYFVTETSEPNDDRFSAQSLDRTLFTVADGPNVPDDSLPTAIVGGTVATDTDKDFYWITLQAGEQLVLDIDGTDTLDAWVKVYDSNGNLIAANDDPINSSTYDPGSTPHAGVDHNMDSFVKVRAPTDGTYYIRVECYNDETQSSAGEYTLNVSIGPVGTQDEVNEENIQAMLEGVAWSDLDLTYGFTSSAADYGPGEGEAEIAAGMSPLNGQQQAAVTTILVQYANLTNLTFAQLAANPGSADLRYARSNDPVTAHAYPPYTFLGPDAGDSWYNTTGYNDPVIGNYEWMAFVHETGHALGLKHGHESPALSPDRDSLEYSVMTYRSYLGAAVDEESGGYTNEEWGYPQTLMTYDIAALQRLYGADFTYNSGDSNYTWNVFTGAFMINGAVQWTPGANRVFMTLWDGGGVDTYDFSNYSVMMEIDLRPGEWTLTSALQLANLGDLHRARGNIANALLHDGDPRSLIENAIGGSDSDIIIANQAVNHLTGNGGQDAFSWKSVGDSLPGSADVVMDFVSGTDFIYLFAIDGRTDTPGDGSFEFIGTAAFSAPSSDSVGQVRYDVVGGNAHIFADVNADSVADFQLIVNNVTVLSISDFGL